MAAGSRPDDDTTRPQDDPPHPADQIYADGPATEEIAASEAAARAEAERLAASLSDDDASTSSASATPGGDAPEPAEAAKPDDVIREPEDIEPDTTEGEGGADVAGLALGSPIGDAMPHATSMLANAEMPATREVRCIGEQ